MTEVEGIKLPESEVVPLKFLCVEFGVSLFAAREAVRRGDMRGTVGTRGAGKGGTTTRGAFTKWCEKYKAAKAEQKKNVKTKTKKTKKDGAK